MEPEHPKSSSTPEKEPDDQLLQHIETSEFRELASRLREECTQFAVKRITKEFSEAPDAVKESLDPDIVEKDPSLSSCIRKIVDAVLELEQSEQFSGSRLQDLRIEKSIQIIDEARKRGTIEQLLCQHLELSHLNYLAAFAGLHIPGVRAIYSGVWLPEEKETIEEAADCNFYDSEYAFFHGEILDQEKREWIKDILKEVITFTFSKHRSGAVIPAEDLAAKPDDQNNELFKYRNLAFSPIRYGDNCLGFITILFDREDDNLNTTAKNHLELISRATAEALAKMWRVKDATNERSV